MSESERIAGFWRWWQQRAGTIADAVETGAVAEFTDEISAQVDTVNPELQWELAPGNAARHALVVSSGGDPDLRPLAERWFRAAPPADATWEYRPARAADPSTLDKTLGFGPHDLELGLAELAISIDDDRQLVDVSVYHPLFAELPDEPRTRIAFLVLGWLLGEDGVERWIGGIEAVTERPADALPAEALPEIIDGIAERNPDDQWSILQGQAEDGTVLLVTARRPLKWIDYPLYDQHIAVSLGYADRNPAGLPEPDALEALRAAEDELLAILGDTVVLAAVATVDGIRTFHLYADGQNPTARDRASRWVEATQGAHVEVTADPGWNAVSRYA
nr:DUF695 domain-containing protein [Kibdelosporangium sp. MJ126-NF4]CEL20064.1 hypothetical protein [Kibdelosporangium sp. MJ126-NF4]CTQ97288.1 hypothetical protein [Kibdelosporangium sp. MJ126-NF4]